MLQRGEVREKSQVTAGPTFPPEIWQKELIEPACLAYGPSLDTLKVGAIEGPARKFRTQAELSRGKNHAQKRRRRTKFCSHCRPMRGRIRTKTTTINHVNLFTHVLGVCLFNSGSIGLLWPSRCHFSSAALFRELEHRLIVLNYAFSYSNSPMKLKLSQT